ncbi:CmpA/NrtA family ABC transporter substrate-binding protein [Roseibium sediminicola]|uniref:ABC transporter substrate-binding protein n=1 Tax=Roseibium sediminicola TaxID=2933272 RepID=A0ABT0GYL2_9HYPH|nr:CmpA/NrtA family ABC transporter substrate-binding protein [Roseibium sp. CAU 1639]MCK7614522.1 ABC transporter substrate-binding protein [Roseibium sp. CAU 1639]
MDTNLRPVIAGFIPLLDSAVVVAAAEKGFAEQEGIALKLIRETSWANIRDRISVGHFDVAHMLAPMPIAASLNLTSLAVPMRAPMLLGLGGNAITVSTGLWSDMARAGADPFGDPASTGKALADVIAVRQEADAPLLHFGVVHPFSGHAYELRYWLAAAGIDPDRDVEITVLAPQVMADALKGGQLDGYCVGEPWNTAAVDAGTGRIATYKQAIWPDSPEKVLGVTEKWAHANPETLAALMRAFSAAADWCADLRNNAELADILSRPDILGCPAETCLAALSGQLRLGPNTKKSVPGFLSFASGVKAAPMPAHGKWFYRQMVRWGQAAHSEAALKDVEKVFAPEAYLSALGLEDVVTDVVIEMFDGEKF